MPDPSVVISLRAARDAARARFDVGLEQVKRDIEMRSVGARIAGKVQSDAKAAGIYALDVMRDNKGVVGGTIAALGVWFFREPITIWIDEHFGNTEDDIDAMIKDATDD